MVTRYPLACSNLASDAAIIPFPKDDETPPVTKMYFVVLMNTETILTIRDAKVGDLLRKAIQKVQYSMIESGSRLKGRKFKIGSAGL